MKPTIIISEDMKTAAILSPSGETMEDVARDWASFKGKQPQNQIALMQEKSAYPCTVCISEDDMFLPNGKIIWNIVRATACHYPLRWPFVLARKKFQLSSHTWRTTPPKHIIMPEEADKFMSTHHSKPFGWCTLLRLVARRRLREAKASVKKGR